MEPNEEDEAIDLAADQIECGDVRDVNDDFWRHGLALCIVRDIMRSKLPMQGDVDVLLRFMQAEFDRLMKARSAKDDAKTV